MYGRIAYYWRAMRAATHSVTISLRQGDILAVEHYSYRMLETMFQLLAQLNGKTYTGFTLFISELKRLNIVPEGFKELAEQITRGQLYATSDLRRRLATVSEGFDKLYEG